MRADYHRLLLLFVDGLGLAPPGAPGPLSRLPTPHLERLLGGPLAAESLQAGENLALAALDARLGVEGLPQSATGQTALFTGVNAARRMGRHVSAFPGPRLRAILAEGSLFRRVRERRLEVTFANAYSAGYLRDLAAGRRRASATTCAVEAAGLGFRGLEELSRGEAVTWDIERDRVAAMVEDPIETIDAYRAGRQLAALARRQRLTVYETFITDLAGHRRQGWTGAEAVRRVDDLVGGVLAGAGDSLTVLLTSDHGNLEDETTRLHTFNPVPLLAVGPLAGRFAGLRSILEVTPEILASLGCQPDAPAARKVRPFGSGQAPAGEPSRASKLLLGRRSAGHGMGANPALPAPSDEDENG